MRERAADTSQAVFFFFFVFFFLANSPDICENFRATARLYIGPRAIFRFSVTAADVCHVPQHSECIQEKRVGPI